MRELDNITEYSNVIITDDNFDDEHEKLCEIIGISHTAETETYETLPDGFIKQEAFGSDDKGLGFYEYVRGMVVNQSPGRSCAVSVGEVAYKFGNVFISKHFEVLV